MIDELVRNLLEAAMLSQTLRPRGALTTALYGSSILLASVVLADSFDVLNYVDPLIGTANGGAKSSSHWPDLLQLTNVLARPCLPWSNPAFWLVMHYSLSRLS